MTFLTLRFLIFCLGSPIKASRHTGSMTVGAIA